MPLPDELVTKVTETFNNYVDTLGPDVDWIKEDLVQDGWVAFLDSLYHGTEIKEAVRIGKKEIQLMYEAETNA